MQFKQPWPNRKTLQCLSVIQKLQEISFRIWKQEPSIIAARPSQYMITPLMGAYKQGKHMGARIYSIPAHQKLSQMPIIWSFQQWGNPSAQSVTYMTLAKRINGLRYTYHIKFKMYLYISIWQCNHFVLWINRSCLPFLNGGVGNWKMLRGNVLLPG